MEEPKVKTQGFDKLSLFGIVFLASLLADAIVVFIAYLVGRQMILNYLHHIFSFGG